MVTNSGPKKASRRGREISPVLKLRAMHEDQFQGDELGERSAADHEQAVLTYTLGIKAEEHRVARIANALRKKGKYGTCYDCGEPIAEIRLNSEENVIRCKDCQELREKPRS